jgi:hypothetical protein
MAPADAWTSLFLGPSLRRPFADFVFPCPACGADVSYNRRYWGFATAGQAKAILTGFILVMLGVIIFMVLTDR